MALRELRNFVGGEHVDVASGASAPVIDPSTGDVIARAPLSGEADVDRALQVAEEAFGSWKRSTPSERSMALLLSLIHI